MMNKIAIIGTASGQKGLYFEAKKAGYYTIGFSWEISSELKSYVDKFYEISILEKDRIVEICHHENVQGIVSNGSELTIQIVSYVAERLNLPCTPYQTILNIQDKYFVRRITDSIAGLNQVKYRIYDGNVTCNTPCVIKPTRGGGKVGVSYVSNLDEFNNAIAYANTANNSILIEEYIDGQEVSVERISFNKKHYVIQITDKETSGPPHFVELGHHQPSCITKENKNKIIGIVPKILNKIGFTNGATHIEMKLSNNGVYLIEVNPRGGGDEISNKLVELSTGYNYLLSMIQVATGDFNYIKPKGHNFSGIYFLTKQTESLLPFFLSAPNKPWYVDGAIFSSELKESLGNAMRDGYLIYKSNHKISPRT